MKAFRLPWPWMQHFGKPLKVCVHPDRKSAFLIIGRVIAEKTHDSVGRKIYGAHYRVGMEKDAHNQWSICWSEYNLAGFQQMMYPALILHYRATDERCALDKRAGNSFFSSSIKALTLGSTV